MEDCKPVGSPMTPNTYLVPGTPEERKEFLDLGVSYRRAVGKLMYLNNATRPDLSFVVSQLSQHLNNPSIQHWIAFKRVLRFLKGSQSLSLVLGGTDLSLNAYADADFAACPITRRSTGGYVTRLGGSTVNWNSKKQDTVATSTTEAEYRSAYEGGQDIIWLNNLINGMGIKQKEPPSFKLDNQEAIALSKNEKFKRRTKHVDVKYHWLRELAAKKELIIRYIPTNDMIADVMTKALTPIKHGNFCTLLGLHDVTKMGGNQDHKVIT